MTVAEVFSDRAFAESWVLPGQVVVPSDRTVGWELVDAAIDTRCAVGGCTTPALDPDATLCREHRSWSRAQVASILGTSMDEIVRLELLGQLRAVRCYSRDDIRTLAVLQHLQAITRWDVHHTPGRPLSPAERRQLLQSARDVLTVAPARPERRLWLVVSPPGMTVSVTSSDHRPDGVAIEVVYPI